MLGNINKNKFTMTTLEQQYSTGKKIQKPSDDPIITVRAMKLRTNLSELEQYYEKNIPDAKSWMDVTESALSTVNDILSQVNTYCVQGSSDSLTAKDRKAIVENLQEMKDQIYQEGNTNFAGRYVFTGYKTDTPLVFNDSTENLNYKITEEFSATDLQIQSSVVGSYGLSDFEDTGVTFDDAPKLVETHRIQLSYDNLQTTAPENIQYTKSVSGGLPQEQTPFTNITTVSVLKDNAYTPGDDEINFIPETGELILGKNAYEEFRTADNMKITYGKSTFASGDLKPEHYFDCVVTDTLKPEQDPITYTKSNQEIQYEINYNQKLTINTEGSEAITHQMGRDIDEILKFVNEVVTTETKVEEVNKRLKDANLTETEKERYEKMLEQLDTELELKKDIMQNAFSRGMASSSEQQDQVNMAVADLGSRYVRLELTESRLSGQKVDFEDMLSTNEDADLVETYIKFSAAETIYNASLSAASKVVQNTLLDFL